MGSYHLIFRYRVPVLQDERALWMHDIVYKTMWMYLTPMNYTCKNS